MAKSNKELIVPTYLAIGIFIIWAGTWWVIFHYLPGDQPEIWAKRGQFGDLFGSVNALFSGLAFAGIIYTIFIQKEELELQHKAIAASTTELANQVEAQKKTSLIITEAYISSERPWISVGCFGLL